MLWISEPEVLFTGGPEVLWISEPEVLFTGEPEVLWISELEVLFTGEPQVLDTGRAGSDPGRPGALPAQRQTS